MASQKKLKYSGLIICIVSWSSASFLLAAANIVMGYQQFSSEEFREALVNDYTSGNYEKAAALIREHRLLVKPAFNTLLDEGLTLELERKKAESVKILDAAEKAATDFEKIFGERCLTIGFGYLSGWNKNQKKDKLAADSLYSNGTSLRSVEPEKAAEIYKNALAIYRVIGDERGEAEVLGGLGLIYTNSSEDYQTGLKYYREALTKREKVDDRQLMGNSYNSLGSIYYSYLKNYHEALTWFEKAEKIRCEICDTLNLGRTVHLKAATYEKLGDFDRALVYYDKSYSLNETAGDRSRMCESLLKSGTILNGLGKYTEALARLSQASEIARAVSDATLITDVLCQTGFVYVSMGDYESALGRFNEALEIAKGQDDSLGLAGVYNNLAIMLQYNDKTEKALGYYLRALSIYENQEDQASVLIALNNIGTVYFDLKEYSRAEEYHAKGLKLSQNLEARDQETNYLLNLANDQSLLGKHDEAIANYTMGLGIARAMNNPDLTWRYLAGLAEHYERRGEYGRVIALNDTVLQIIESLRSAMKGEEFRTNYMARERWVFEDIINLLGILHGRDGNKGYDTLAFSYEERSKSRGLLDMLSHSDDTLTKKTGSGLKKAGDPEPVSLKKAQSLCPDRNTVILEYSVGDSSSYMWVITSADHRFFALPPRKTLREQIETIRFALLNPEEKISEFYTRSGNYLYEALLKPAEQYLSAKSRLIIIPDDVLNYLPFEVLLTDNKQPGGKSNYSDLAYLIKKCPVSYAQSVSVLSALLTGKTEEIKRGPGNKRLIAFGDPVYNNLSDSLSISGSGFNRLEYSRKEIEMIAACFPDGSADVYLGNNATEEKAKAKGTFQSYDYVHFAAHGLVDEKKPDMSSIVLTQNNEPGEDGFLRAAEIFKLDINAELVVLSACQTGLGKLIRGEGMVGLTRAFMYAGSPAVMVSLWSVSDLSTATLMGEFYRNLGKKRLCKTDALRQAQLAMLKQEKYAHPYYWAPFILFGDWR